MNTELARAMATVAQVAKLDEAGLPLTLENLGRALWIRPLSAKKRLWDARRLGVTDRRPVGQGVPGAPKGAGKRRVQLPPATPEELKAEAYRGMKDGRGEIDLPPHGTPPSSGKQHRSPSEPPAAAVARLVKDWKVRTGRVKPKPAEPEPGTGRAPRPMLGHPSRPSRIGRYRGSVTFRPSGPRGDERF